MEEDDPVPENIQCSDQLFDVNHHPHTNVLAAAVINGNVELWSYSLESNKRLFKNHIHNEGSCRGVLFTPSGDKLFSISSDLSIKALDGNGQLILSYDVAHPMSINRIINLSEMTIATGDDSGGVKVWDIRIGQSPQASWNIHEDYVSGLHYQADSNSLLSVGGDAKLAFYDLRNPNNTYISDEQESEINCVEVLKDGKKILSGTQDGVLLIFSWGKWGDCTDRFPGHPETIDCIHKIDETTVLTGSSDGLIRVLSIQPNKILGVIGDHDDFPVEGISRSYNKKVLTSFAHDESIRFWDLSIFDDSDGEDDEDEVGKEAIQEGVKDYSHINCSSADNAMKVEEDWEDVEENDEFIDNNNQIQDYIMNESDDESEEMESSASEEEEDYKGSKSKNVKIKSKNEKFFKDL